MVKSLLWLASYPKSGNTWMRAFLANYIFNPNQPFPLDHLSRVGISDASTSAHRRAAGGPFDPADPKQVLSVRRRMLDLVDQNGADLNLVKTHNQRARAFGQELVPPHLTRGAIYILRDPRDMAISYASHHGLTLDEAIQRINRPDNATAGDQKNVPQFLGTWSAHVRGWTRVRGFPVLVVRYEDMLDRPEEVFSRALSFLGLDLDDARLGKAIDFSSFDRLSAQEREKGFAENSAHQESFFRTGKAGTWRDALTGEQAEKLVTDHRRIMRQFGYLD